MSERVFYKCFPFVQQRFGSIIYNRKAGIITDNNNNVASIEFEFTDVSFINDQNFELAFIFILCLCLKNFIYPSLSPLHLSLSNTIIESCAACNVDTIVSSPNLVWLHDIIHSLNYKVFALNFFRFTSFAWIRNFPSDSTQFTIDILINYRRFKIVSFLSVRFEGKSIWY